MMDVEANETDPSCESRVLFWIVTRAFHVCDSRFCDFGKSKLVTAAPHGCRVQDSRFHQTRPRSRLTPHASRLSVRRASAPLCVYAIDNRESFHHHHPFILPHTRNPASQYLQSRLELSGLSFQRTFLPLSAAKIKLHRFQQE